MVESVFSPDCICCQSFFAGLKIEGDKEQVTVISFEAGSTGLKISSLVLGLIIPVISLVFFYL